MFAGFERAFSRTVKALCTVWLALIFVMFLLNVFVRFVPIYNFTQTDDWIQFCLIWMLFAASAELVRTRRHFVVDVLVTQVKSSAAAGGLRALALAIEAITYGVVFYYGIVWVMRSGAYFQSIPWLQVRYAYLALPVSAFFMLVFALRDLIGLWRHGGTLPAVTP